MATSTTQNNDLSYFEHLRLRNILVVCGYIREQETILFPSNHHIPSDICDVVIRYFYRDFDRFDPALHGSLIQISKNGFIATHNGWSGGRIMNSIFLSNIVKSEVHCWTFKIIEYKLNNEDNFYIGIWDNKYSISKAVLNGSCVSWEKQQPAQVLNGRLGKLRGYNANLSRKYCKKFKKGDIIIMILDLEKEILKYTINGTDKGDAFKVKRREHGYRVVVGMEGFGHSIELL